MSRRISRRTLLQSTSATMALATVSRRTLGAAPVRQRLTTGWQHHRGRSSVCRASDIGQPIDERSRDAERQADEPHKTHDGRDLAPKRHSRRVAAAGRKKGKDEASEESAKPPPRDSKQARVIEMLRRRQGASIAVIRKATGWQPHSVRGFFAGVVRKRLGLTLVSEKTGTERVYRILVKTAPRKGKSSRKAA